MFQVQTCQSKGAPLATSINILHYYLLDCLAHSSYIPRLTEQVSQHDPEHEYPQLLQLLQLALHTSLHEEAEELNASNTFFLFENKIFFIVSQLLINMAGFSTRLILNHHNFCGILLQNIIEYECKAMLRLNHNQQPIVIETISFKIL